LKKIIVKTSTNSYPVHICNSELNKLPEKLDELNLYKNLLIIIDENVARYYQTKIKSVFSYHSGKIIYYILPSGEKIKSEKELKKIYDFLLKNNFGRDTVLIAIGGGVTGDLAGYAASTFMRGIQLIHVPTTFLAMIDSSVGGKTGINFNKKKNLIGTFYQPKLVFVDIMFLSTLPAREFNSALGELIKYGLISNKDFYYYLLNNLEKIKSIDDSVIERIIKESVSIKAGVIEQDEFEQKGIRKILNLGHTFAHAIESELGFRVKHGEAVTAGIICSLFLSNKIGLLETSKQKSLLQLPSRVRIPAIVNKINNQNVFDVMQSDKKNKDDKIMFVLISGIGNLLVDVPANKREIFYTLNKMKQVLLPG
jgi:3-dehydroquinate synthase